MGQNLYEKAQWVKIYTNGSKFIRKAQWVKIYMKSPMGQNLYEKALLLCFMIILRCTQA